jgi:hypothetical protein
MRTQRMADSCPNYQDILSHKLRAYFLEFDLLAQFGRLSVDDRLNCESSEFRGTCVVVPKSKWQTAIVDQKRSSSELCASIAHEQYRFLHTSRLGTWYEQV